MKPYLLDGKKAQGEDYLVPLDSLSDEDDVRIGFPGECSLIVYICSEGFFVTEERIDGSTYLTTGLTKDRTKVLINSFLNGAEDWRDGLEWELTTLPSKRAARRSLVLLVLGAALIAFVLWLTEHFAQ